MSLAVAKRVALAGLTPVAERIAAEHKIPVAALFGVTGRVSPAQADLFRAIAETKSPAEIAALLGWGEGAVRRALGMPATVAPKHDAGGSRDDRFDRRLRYLRKRVLELEARDREREAEIAELRRAVAAIRSRVSLPASTDPKAIAAREAAVSLAMAHKVPIDDLLGKRRSAKLDMVRRLLIGRMRDELRMSQSAIAVFMGRRPKAVGRMLRDMRQAAPQKEAA